MNKLLIMKWKKNYNNKKKKFRIILIQVQKYRIAWKIILIKVFKLYQCKQKYLNKIRKAGKHLIQDQINPE